jgi:protein-S-isoprenylcysteine O-methyltransferase Ste14
MAYRLAVVVIGTVVGAYWLRVLRMARKARKKNGRAAHFLPPEPVGRLLRLIWIPVVVVWITHPFFTAATRSAPLVARPLFGSAWIAWPAALATAACFWASRICWKTMGKNWRMGIDPTEQNALVLGGPYAYVRHPIYALSQAMMLATAIALPSPLMIAAGLTHVLLLQWEARREEGHLRGVHGSRYADYCQVAGRFIPRLRGAIRGNDTGA